MIAVAAWINATWPATRWGRPVKQDAVRRWMHGKQLPYGCNEPMPGYRGMEAKGSRMSVSGRYYKSKLLPWIKKWLVPSGEAPVASQLPLPGTEPQTTKEKREQLKYEQELRADQELQKSNDGKHILITKAEAELMSAIAVLWNHFTRILEVDLPQWMATIAPEHAAAARDRCQAAVDALQAQCERYAKGERFQSDWRPFAAETAAGPAPVAYEAHDHLDAVCAELAAETGQKQEAAVAGAVT